MIRFNIEEEGLEFKNLISGPAPVGRILNYIHHAGTIGLFHKNGYRSLDFRDQIGSAWATEFMIGLGLLRLGDDVGDRTQLLLTDNGRSLFDAMQENYIIFNEGSRDEHIDEVRNQMDACSPDLYTLYRNVFVNSRPFAVLKDFLDDYGYYYPDENVFKNDYFERTKTLYENGAAEYNRESRTPTAHNRVPSIIQLCKLFNFAESGTDGLHFCETEFNNAITNTHGEYTHEELIEAAEQAELIQTDAASLAERYGIEGNVIIESVVRNSSLQDIFKHNLIISQNGRCIMCGISNRELLIGSHIRPAANSNVCEKADYNNGLLLCCNHDKLFDRYLITFNFLDGHIEISKTISDTEYTLLGLNPEYHLPEDLLTPERAQYLMEHNMEFRRREDER